LLYENSLLELDIEDDGSGFVPPENELANVGHFGVLGMRERMEQIGGTLEVSSAPGEGTAISARLLIKNKAPIRG
jgi:signal transduction histidine kinase